MKDENNKGIGKDDPEFTAKALGDEISPDESREINEDEQSEFDELQEFAKQLSSELKAGSEEENLSEAQIDKIENESTHKKQYKVLRFPVWVTTLAACLAIGGISFYSFRDETRVEEYWDVPPLRKQHVGLDAAAPAAPEPSLASNGNETREVHAYLSPGPGEVSEEFAKLDDEIGRAISKDIAMPSSKRLEIDDEKIVYKGYIAQTADSVMQAEPVEINEAVRQVKASSQSLRVKEEALSFQDFGAVNELQNVSKKRLAPKMQFAPSPRKKESEVLYNREGYNEIEENIFHSPLSEPLSTFSIDVDTASYSNVRRFIEQGVLPPADAVRIEEFVNYFAYDYKEPESVDPFSVAVDSATAPWNADRKLVRIALKGKDVALEDRQSANLVFLIDVSGSMSNANKLPLAKKSMKRIVDQMGEDDRIAIVVYAGNSGLALPSTTANNRETIKHAIDNLESGGSTNGGAGIELAYKTAKKHFIEDGINRVILCTDGDFNVGTTSQGSLADLIEEKRETGIFFSAIGFGRGNYRDDMMETLSNKGNGNYAYIDSPKEARKVFGQELLGSLQTIAKDVKIQVEFNPTKVKAYRLIGYENRKLNKEDFNNDRKDAGEIGVNHRVTAFYEIVPADGEIDLPSVDPLKYQSNNDANPVNSSSDELLTVKLRYKEPRESKSKLLSVVLQGDDQVLSDTSDDFRFSTAVAAFAMKLRNSKEVASMTFDDIEMLAEGATGRDALGHRDELIELVRKARLLKE